MLREVAHHSAKSWISGNGFFGERRLRWDWLKAPLRRSLRTMHLSNGFEGISAFWQAERLSV